MTNKKSELGWGIMDIPLDDVLNRRRSVRGYKPDAIPDSTLQAIFTEAQRAPSNCNTQPWSVYVASGEVKNELGRQLVALASGGQKPNADFFYNDNYAGLQRQRQVECAMALYGSMGVDRRDKAGRQGAMLKNFTFFDAPHVAYICMQKEHDVGNAVDVGIYLQTLMLVMAAHGVACCPQGALAFYTSPPRELLDIDDSQGIVVGLSFGYEDSTVPANKTITTRAPLSEVVRFIG